MQKMDVQKMLPTFDSDSKSGMNVDELIEAVEELTQMYGITENMIMAAVSMRWTGSALVWFNNRRRERMVWAEMKVTLKETFRVKKSI